MRDVSFLLRVGALCCAIPVSTKTSTTLGTKTTLGTGRWGTKALLIASFAGVGILGIAVGRSSNPIPDSPATVGDSLGPPGSPALGIRASAAPQQSSPEALKVDLAELPNYKAGVPMRPMDRDIFDKIRTLSLERSQMHDVFPDRPYRVTFVGSLAERRIDLVMVDLDRDGKFEERWEIKRGDVVRTVPKDPAAGDQPVKYTIIHGRWQPH